MTAATHLDAIQPAATDRSTVRGTIRGTWGRPYYGARVRLVGGPRVRETRSIEGRYRFDGVAPGRYRVEVVAGRVVFARRVDVGAGGGASVHFNLR